MNRNATWFFAALILLIGVLNLVWPHSYALFAVDHASYLPRTAQVLLLAVALALAVAARWGERLRVPGWVLAAAAVAIVLSFVVLRTEFPGVHGDGETGGSPAGDAPDWRVYPEGDGRLQSFLAYGVGRLVPDTFRFRYHFSGLFHDFVKSSTWIFTVLVAGTLLAVLLTLAVRRLRIADGARLGLLLVLLASPPILNAYGHFDSYILPVLCVALWFVAAWRAAGPAAGVSAWAAVAAAVLLGAWSHPVLLLLAVYSACLAALVLLERWGKRAPGWAVAGAGVLLGLSPYALGRGNMTLLRPESAGDLLWLLHEKLMSGLQVSLPALALIVVLLLASRGASRPGARERMGWITAVSAVLLFFTLGLGYGIRDEFMYSVVGAIVLGGGVFVFLERGAPAPAALGAAVLSLYLWGPRVHVYGGEQLLDRFQHHILHDPSSVGRYFSPYYVAASFTPVDARPYQERRLRVLMEGFANPLPAWSAPELRVTARAHYAAWCYEFNQPARAGPHLEWLMDHSPQTVPFFWKGSGRPFRTDHYLNRCPRLARQVTAGILERKLRDDPDNDTLKALFAEFRRMELTEPVGVYSPRPGTTRRDLERLDLPEEDMVIGLELLEKSQ